ncbi:hypothetical protein B7H23_14805 [Notoacmeibacter marinus]|uniref:Uracil-DNA glycosylase-like domain-containing protein n=2 Tax=Notoacmeibacter marinus TaxID=1876515 RepID=A0A231UU19_9HYPH|nr:hypothetical protein B7H23_14805 [Notoacmeibacter marinus]
MACIDTVRLSRWVMDDLAGILEFYRDAGVDTPLDDQPANRLALPEPADTGPSQSPQRQAGPAGREAMPNVVATSSNDTPAMGQDLPARIAEANEIARQADTIDALREALVQWDGIDLAQTVPTMVFGSGPETAALLVLADCPERQDVSGEQLWSGAGGRMVDMMLAAIGQSRADTRFAAACPWRAPGGIATDEQQAVLRPFLLRHIALSQPKIVLTFGQTALKSLTGQQGNFLKDRGRWHEIELAVTDEAMEPVAVRPTFHPHYLMKNPAQKRLTWADLLAVKSRLADGG